MSQTEVEERSSQRPPAIVILLGVLTLGPLLIIIILFATNIYVPIGAALGVNIPSDDNLRVYDVECWLQADNPQIYVLYWTNDPAPMIIRFDDTESIVFNSPAGINTIDVSIREEGIECPSAIILEDRSRNRQAGGSVRIQEDDE